MPSLDRSAFCAAILAVGAFSACVGDGRGAEGEPCKLGAVNYFCNEGLSCNNTLMWTRCVRPMSLLEGDVCGSNDVCQAGLSCVFQPDPTMGGLNVGRCRPAFGDGGSASDASDASTGG